MTDMPGTQALTLCAQMTLDLHNLNNEGTEGNQQQTRMVTVLDQNGDRRVVNAVSGDMLKHMLVEHLIPLLDRAKQPLSPGARAHSADRITAGQTDFSTFAQNRSNSDTSVLNKMLKDCSLTDIAGALVTGNRAVARKSVVELGWAVGLPDVTITEQFFHVKYAPESRATATGGESVEGRQPIFHRPASSGIYALVCNLDLWRIGQNDITRSYVVSQSDRTARARALLYALSAMLVKPVGAQRATQAPHVLGLDGVIATSTTTLPAPMVSPLSSDFKVAIGRIAATYNSIAPDSIQVWSVPDLAECVDRLARIAAELEAPENPNGSPN
jgi:CRISPR-associated protein Cst2